MKTCAKCNQDKHRADFGNDRSRPDGLFAYCKECVKKLGKSKDRLERSDQYISFRVLHKSIEKTLFGMDNPPCSKDFILDYAFAQAIVWTSDNMYEKVSKETLKAWREEYERHNGSYINSDHPDAEQREQKLTEYYAGRQHLMHLPAHEADNE